MVHFIRTETRLTRPDPTARILRAAEHTALVELRRVLDEARAEAAAIVGSAESVVARARDQGYAEGREAARIEAAEQMISTVVGTVEYYGRVEDQMLEVVLEATRRIMDDFGDVQRARAVVKSALAVVRNQRHVTLRVTPANCEPLRLQLNEILAHYPGISNVDIVSDGRLNGDACIVESELGVVEASIESQMTALKAAFASILGARR